MRGVASRCRAANCIPLAVARGFAACVNEGLCRLGQLHCSREMMIAGNRRIFLAAYFHCHSLRDS